MNHTVPWTTRIFELLADGPQSLEYVVAEVRNMVPPGRAYRQAEKKRRQQAARRVRKSDRKTPKLRPPTEDETIRTGQRQIVMDSISKLARVGRLKYIEGPVRQIELGRERELGGMTPNHPLIRKLHEHEPTFTKRRLPGEFSEITGRPVDVYDWTCSCGVTWLGGRQDWDGDWHIHATSKDQAKIEFTKHRRSFV